MVLQQAGVTVLPQGGGLFTMRHDTHPDISLDSGACSGFEQGQSCGERGTERQTGQTKKPVVKPN